MTDSRDIVSYRIKLLLKDLHMSQNDLAECLNVSQSAISQIITGKTNRSTLLPLIANQLSVNYAWLSGESDNFISLMDKDGMGTSEQEWLEGNRSPDSQPYYRPEPRTHVKQLSSEQFQEISTEPKALPNFSDNLNYKQTDIISSVVAVKHIDLNFGMGATYMDQPVEEKIRYFPIEFLRTYTTANPNDLMWAKGVGDSMNPTISDQDLLLIDSSQNHISMADKIWAVAFGEIGMIKRLRPMPDGSVKILSDNQNVPDESAVDGELNVLGRVVAIVRKI